MLMSTKKKPAQDEGDLHAVLDQVFTTRDFPLASGRALPELRIAYETYGALKRTDRPAGKGPELARRALLRSWRRSRHEGILFKLQ